MKEFTVVIPDDCNPSKPSFPMLLLEKTQEFTSETITVQSSSSPLVADAKSMIGVYAIPVNAGDSLTFKVAGEMEDYAARKLELWLPKVFKIWQPDDEK